MTDQSYDDEYDEVEGEIVSDESLTFESLIPARGPLDQRDDLPEPSAGPTLASLLLQYLDMLGWTQVDLADASGKDPSQISKIMSGHTRRPHDNTLQVFVDVFQKAGLDGVTLEHLQFARDSGTHHRQMTLWNIPAHWLRLVQSVMAHDQNFQDAMYRKWSLDLRETSALIARRSPKSDTESE